MVSSRSLFKKYGTVPEDHEERLKGWPLFALGTMSRLDHWNDNFLVAFFLSSLRAVGQVTFLNNPISGALIIAASFVQDPFVAACGLYAVFVAHCWTVILQLDKSAYHSGLFGYNAYLVGLAFATIQGWKDGAVLIAILISSLFSVILCLALSNLLGSRNVPVLTFPFNLASFVFLMGSIHMEYMRHSTNSALSVATPDDHAFDILEFLASIFLRSHGQIFLMDNLISGGLVFGAMFFFSPYVGFLALVGSFFGNLTAIMVGAPFSAVANGLWGYNAVLCAIAVGGMFYAPSLKSFVLACLCAMVGTLLTPCLQVHLAPSASPPLTLPFCLATAAFLLAGKGLEGRVHHIPLSEVTVPEHHRAYALERSRVGGEDQGRRRPIENNSNCYS